MKFYKYIIGLIITGLLFTTSCKDESTLIINPNEVPKGVFLYLDVETPVIDISDLAGSSFKGTVTAPSENVVSYDMSVCWVSNGVASDTVPLKNYTSFPANVTVNATELAAALGVTTDQFLAGDAFNIISTATGLEGNIVSIDNLDQDAAGNPGEKQAFNYTIFISCPFVASEAAGTYQWTEDPWGTWIDDGIFEVVAGPGENQITCIDVFDHPNLDEPGTFFDMIIDVDPLSGVATVEKQNTWHPGNWGIPPGAGWGLGTHDGGGFVFSCSGTISLILNVNMDLGGWGPQVYVAQRISKKTNLILKREKTRKKTIRYFPVVLED